MDITRIINLIGIIQGLFILILILTKAKSKSQSKYAGLLMAVFVLDLLTFYIIRSGLINEWTFLSGFAEVTLFLYGPVLYLYISSILLNNFHLKARKLILHFAPALLVFLATSQIFFGEITYSKLSEWQTQLPLITADYSLGNLIFGHLIWYTYSIFYFILCLNLIRNFTQQNKGAVSNSIKKAKKIHIRWVQYLVIGYLIFPALGLCLLLFNIFSGYNTDSYSILNLFMVFHVFSISYIGFSNQELLINPIGMLKYRKSGLDEKTISDYLEKLENYFKDQSPYLNPKLKLEDLAKSLDISIHHLSQAINDRYGYGFNEFVNNYRIELSKEYILSPEKQIYTIEAIANEVGFQSKPTFNTAFKKKEGITPSEYKRRNIL